MNRVLVWGVAAAALVALLLTLAGERGMLGNSPHSPRQAVEIGGAFSLVNGDGETVTEADFGSDYLLVSFGFTSCPDICPMALHSIGQAMDLLDAESAQLQPLFITLDPERDTPQVVDDYATAFHPKLIGLTGNATQIAGAAGAYRVYYAKVPTPDDVLAYTIDHSAYIYLMGPDGAYLTHFSHNSSPEDIAASVSRLMRSKERKL